MVNINIKVESETLDSNDVIKGVNNITPTIANIIEDEAKSNHRYKSRTGNLTSATKAVSTKDAVRAYIDDTKAKYGKYIHDGKGRWSPDPFLDKAVANNLDRIDILLADSIDRELQGNR